jgi:tRNA 2-thiouridine synthesizing protein B
MLHTVNKSPFEKNSLVTCLSFARPGSDVLLIEDGIYGALKGTQFESVVTESLKNCHIYVLEADLRTRGMREGDVISGITLASYSDFVDLVVNNNTVKAWL